MTTKIPKIDILNKFIKSLGYDQTYIDSLISHPLHEYNEQTGDFELKNYALEVNIITDVPQNIHEVTKSLKNFTDFEFLISLLNNEPYKEKTESH